MLIVQILVISAHLKRSDVELWAKAGQLALDMSNLSLASRCYQQGPLVEGERERERRKRGFLCSVSAGANKPHVCVEKGVGLPDVERDLKGGEHLQTAAPGEEVTTGRSELRFVLQMLPPTNSRDILEVSKELAQV